MGGKGQLLYEHLNITQDGYLVKWTFTGVELGLGEVCPKLRIYRNEIEQLRELPRALDLPPQISAAVSTLYPNVYNVIVAPPFPVRTGDSIGLFLPVVTTARLSLTLLLTGSPPGMNLDTGENIEGLPLITLEIGMSYFIRV